MSIPDLRKSACCFYCHNHSAMFRRCLKYDKPVDMLEVCAKFITSNEIEGRQDGFKRYRHLP